MLRKEFKSEPQLSESRLIPGDAHSTDRVLAGSEGKREGETLRRYTFHRQKVGHLERARGMRGGGFRARGHLGK